MSPIHILPTDLQNQIAAGEVVERPASVVKELVENSIDAGADRISIEVEQGGKKKIRIIDNGAGMKTPDAKLSVQRYATSKLRTREDLQNIRSFGFRGEALASITSVSEFRLRTKTAAEVKGTEITLNNASEVKNQDIGCPQGTDIAVHNLFQNFPARLKYLKADQTEFRHILESIQNIALIHHDVHFKVKHNGKIVLELPKTGTGDFFTSFEKRIYDILGNDLRGNIKKIEQKRPECVIRGFTGIPAIARSNRKQQYTFVNKRPIKSPLISAAVQEAYHSLLPHGRYPLFVFDIEITADLIDVNIHPRKQEIRFLREREMYQFVRGAVEHAIKSEKELDLTRNISSSFLPEPEKNLLYKKPSWSSGAERFTKQITGFGGQQSLSVKYVKEKTDRIIGQLADSYILIEKKEGLLILDQHAAHERIRYEGFMNDLKNKKPVGQNLLLPSTIQLSYAEAEILRQHKKFLQDDGFQYEETDTNTFSITAVPNIVADFNHGTILKGLIDDIQSYTPDEGQSITQIQEKIITYLSCRKAVKFGDEMDMKEMQKLYEDLMQCEKHQTCPHGRSIFYYIPLAEIRKQVNR